MIQASAWSRRPHGRGPPEPEGCSQVSFYVAVYQQARPDRVQQLLSAIRRSFAASRTTTPGRHAARVFQRLNEPTTLLSLAEWDSQGAFEAYRDSPAFNETTQDIGPPPTLGYFRRLYLFERMYERSDVVACATISVATDQEPSVFDHLMGAAQRDMVQRPGLKSREVYQQVGSDLPNASFLVVHSWRSLTDLEAFRTSDASQFEANLKQWGAEVARFTGEIAVEYSRADEATDA